jgi:hypothetical protein
MLWAATQVHVKILNDTIKQKDVNFIKAGVTAIYYEWKLKAR